MESLAVPDAAILVADLAGGIPREEVESAILGILREPFCIERLDSVFRMCNDIGIVLPPEILRQIAGELVANESAEVLHCAQAILVKHAVVFAESDVQELLFKGLERPPEFAMWAFLVCLNCCRECPVAAPLLEAFHGFASEHEGEFEEEIHGQIAEFLASHQ
jgi:hypothetical protein